MATKCSICGKTSTLVWQKKKLRGKYNPTTKVRRYPNLQWVRLTSGLRPPKLAMAREGGKRVKACTKCIKALGKTN
jgi:ribosomal protein L28